MVTNGGGSPFLNKLSSGDQSAVMFLFPSDAQKMLKAVLKAPNGASSGAKVLPSNLDRALKLAMLPPSNSGLRDPASGRDLSMSWQVRLRPLRASSFLCPCPLVLALSPPTSYLPPPTAHLAPLTSLASLASRLSPLTSHL